MPSRVYYSTVVIVLRLSVCEVWLEKEMEVEVVFPQVCGAFYKVSRETTYPAVSTARQSQQLPMSGILRQVGGESECRMCVTPPLTSIHLYSLLPVCRVPPQATILDLQVEEHKALLSFEDR